MIKVMEPRILSLVSFPTQRKRVMALVIFCEAYDIQPLLDSGTTGKGATIVILDAYQAPHIQDDLNRFDDTFGLKDIQLNIIAPDGLTPFNPQNTNQVGWSSEISLDVEWAHAIAPDATINSRTCQK